MSGRPGAKADEPLVTDLRRGQRYRVTEGPSAGREGVLVHIYKTGFGHVYGELEEDDGQHVHSRESGLELVLEHPDTNPPEWA